MEKERKGEREQGRKRENGEREKGRKREREKERNGEREHGRKRDVPEVKVIQTPKPVLCGGKKVPGN